MDKVQWTMDNGQGTMDKVRGIRLRQAYAETGKVFGEPDSVVGSSLRLRHNLAGNLAT